LDLVLLANTQLPSLNFMLICFFLNRKFIELLKVLLLNMVSFSISSPFTKRQRLPTQTKLFCRLFLSTFTSNLSTQCTLCFFTQCINQRLIAESYTSFPITLGLCKFAMVQIWFQQNQSNLTIHLIILFKLWTKLERYRQDVNLKCSLKTWKVGTECMIRQPMRLLNLVFVGWMINTHQQALTWLLISFTICQEV
jgi:hypothetical protein